MRVRIIKPCPKFAYPTGHEFDLDDTRATHWVNLGYMVAMGASPARLPEKPQQEALVVKSEDQAKHIGLPDYGVKDFGHNRRKRR